MPQLTWLGGEQAKRTVCCVFLMAAHVRVAGISVSAQLRHALADA